MKSSTKKGIIVFAVFAVLAAATAVCLRTVTSAAERASVAASGFPVYISEVMASNDDYTDRLGNTYDWVELYNNSDLSITLTNYKLTDSEQKVRYTFPADAEIPAHGYYVVWCRSNEGGKGYADFSISKAGGETIILMNSHGVIVDRIVTLPMDSNTTMVRDATDHWSIQTFGTPGFENSEAGYEAYLAAHRESMFPVRINEIMSSNRSYADERGRCCDWVELYNDSAETVNLSGYLLSDRLGEKGYVFPEGTTLAAHAYLVVYCDGSVADVTYAPFSLTSRGGERVLLMTRANVVMDEVATEPLEPDTTLARGTDGVWAVSMQPTPEYENSEAGYEQYLAALAGRDGEADVRITEIMVSNKTCLRDAYGVFSDWIEITNYGADTVDLQGYYLSDNAEKPAKWAFPEVEIAPGSRIVVFATGRDAAENGELHTSFALGKYRGDVLLSASAGRIVSRIAYEAPGDDVSVCTDETTGEVFTTKRATPGYPNTDAGYEAFSETATHTAGIYINEVMTGNDAYLRLSKAYYDWVELKNGGDKPVDLSGYSLSDDPNGPKQQLPAVTLAPGDFCVVLCTGAEPLAKTTYGQLALSLNAQDERLYLYDKGGGLVDYLWLHDIPYQGSCGRLPGENGQFYFSAPTPGKENKNGFRTITETPEADVASGVFRDVQAVEVTLSGEGTIYYTLDGSIPDEDAAPYTSPLHLTGTTVLRAAGFAEGKLVSRVATWSYIINEPHTLPVVSVVTDPKNITDSKIGILATRNLFDRTVERAAHVDCFFDDGGFSTDCGLKLHGAGTRGRAKKKSFKLTFRGRYGVSPLEYPVFPDNETTTFYSLLLRNGQDTKRACLRDEIIPYFAYRSSTELFCQDGRHCVMYLNGEYYGLYVIKEAFSSGYFSVHYGVSKESVEVQRGYIADGTEFEQLMRYADKHDLRNEEYYKYVSDRVCIDSVIDWCIFEGFCANHDLSVNVRYLRSSEYEDNRWHYALFDLDFGFDGPATFDYILEDHWHGVIPKALMRNDDFQDRFLRRMAYLLENVLTPAALQQRVDSVVSEIRNEIPRNRVRWPATGAWEAHYAKFESYLNMDRAAQLKESASEALGVPLSKVESYFGQGAA